MTIFARPLTRLLGARSIAAPGMLVLSLLGAMVLALLLAAPASAIVETVSGDTVGVQPRSEKLEVPARSEAGEFANTSGNAVVEGSKVYVLFWDPDHLYHHEWVENVDQFMRKLGLGSGELDTGLDALTQYRDRANAGASYNTVFMGSAFDDLKYPSGACVDPAALEATPVACLTDAQVRENVQNFVADNGLPKGMNVIYDVLTPPGVTICLDAGSTHCSDFSGKRHEADWEHSFCSYHGDINPEAAPQGNANTILYGVVPWTAGYQGDLGEFHTHTLYEHDEGYDCQDGGWNAEKHGEEHEEERHVTAEEIASFEKMKPKEKFKWEEELRLENPHNEEPNQPDPGVGSEESGFGPALTDLIINQVYEEQANIVTDPLLDGWQDTGHREVSDVCRDAFASTAGPEGGEISGEAKANLETESGNLANSTIGDSVENARYYLNNLYNEASGHCVGGVALVPRFTSPDPVNPNEVVGFNGMETSISLLGGWIFGPSGPPTKTYAVYSWNFGDGTAASGYAPGAYPCEEPWLTPCAGSVFHIYTKPGEYTVTLTVHDVGGDTASVSHTVDVGVSGAPGGTGAGSSSTAPPTPGPNGTVSPVTVVPQVPAPIARAAILSKSLATTIRKGLIVRYSVNEQVAGHFEVLLARSTARKLGITGSPATGLAAGTPAQLVIAKAILVTTKGGASTIKIQFSKRTDQRLRRLHKVSLMLRLIVRNAASKSPATTTVLTTGTLTG